VSSPFERSFVSRDGVEVAYLEWEVASGGPSLVFVHATGFCKEVSIPIVEEVISRCGPLHAVAIDQRAHGESGVPAVPFDWWDVGGDVVELAGRWAPVVGVGHSAGGAALLLAELTQPGLFDELVLVEPIVFPPPYGRFPDNPMATAARRRRNYFPSREFAKESWSSKPAFSGWQDRAMDAYVSGGLRPEGAGFVLKCTPSSEAEFFTAATEHRAWDRLGEVSVATTIIAGEHSTTHQEPFLGALAGRMPRAKTFVVPGTGHMVWMEQPEAVAERVAAAVARLG
jgi:pimeloyl-ACP methyl ester carboxylesterase